MEMRLGLDNDMGMDGIVDGWMIGLVEKLEAISLACAGVWCLLWKKRTRRVGGEKEREKVFRAMSPVWIRRVLTLVMEAECRESRQGMTPLTKFDTRCVRAICDMNRDRVGDCLLCSYPSSMFSGLCCLLA